MKISMCGSLEMIILIQNDVRSVVSYRVFLGLNKRCDLMVQTSEMVPDIYYPFAPCSLKKEFCKKQNCSKM